MKQINNSIGLRKWCFVAIPSSANYCRFVCHGKLVSCRLIAFPFSWVPEERCSRYEVNQDHKPSQEETDAVTVNKKNNLNYSVNKYFICSLSFDTELCIFSWHLLFLLYWLRFCMAIRNNKLFKHFKHWKHMNYLLIKLILPCLRLLLLKLSKNLLNVKMNK